MRILGFPCVALGIALSACAADPLVPMIPSASQPMKEIAPSELKIPAPKPGTSGSTRQDTTQAPVRVAPAESRTPEEASARAADPKDPSGAIIIKVPIKPDRTP